jgi:hypothetical protein
MAETATTAMEIGLRVSDVSGQKTVRASNVPGYTTIHELVQGLLQRLGLPRNDVEGRPLSYRARLEREGRHLIGSERVGEVLVEDDLVSLQPNIDAGGH